MKISSTTDIGLRNENQDRFIAAPDVLAVADGHGYEGGKVAEKVINFTRSFKYSDTFFADMDKENQDLESGTTISCVWPKGKGKFLAAIIGDSPIFYRFEGKVYQFSDHNVKNINNPDLERIAGIGGTFYANYVVAQNGVSLLAMTRAIGDRVFEDFVSKEPDIYEFEADAVLVSSDGYDGTVEDVTRLFEKKANAERFLEDQEIRGVKDNCTIVVAYGK